MCIGHTLQVDVVLCLFTSPPVFDVGFCCSGITVPERRMYTALTATATIHLLRLENEVRKPSPTQNPQEGAIWGPVLTFKSTSEQFQAVRQISVVRAPPFYDKSRTKQGDPTSA